MSWMLVEGKMCVCKQCDDITLAHYEGGPQFTQIGDSGVWEQEQLAEKYGTTDDPVLSKFYIVEDGLCQKCFDKVDVKSQVLDKWKTAWEIDKQIAEQDRINSLFWQQVNELSGEIMEVWLKEVLLQQVDPAAYKKILSDCKIREKGRIKSLINEYLKKNKETIMLVLEEKLKRETGFSCAEEEYNRELTLCRQELERLLASIPPEDFPYYCNVNLGGVVENLNPYLQASTTTRTVEYNNDSAYYVYYDFSPSEIQIIDELKIPATWSKYIDANYDYIEEGLRKPFAAQVRDAVFGDKVQRP